MAVIGNDNVQTRIKKNKLVVDLGKRELENQEGVGLDLRLGTVFEIIDGGAFIEADEEYGLGKRKGVETKVIAKFNKTSKKQQEILIKPGDYYLVQTIEKINTPTDLMPLVFPRSSLFRAGLLLLNTKTDPGYKGSLVMGLTNLSPFPVKLQMGARICNMVFLKIEGDVINYRGQHQGGRVTPSKIERQV